MSTTIKPHAHVRTLDRRRWARLVRERMRHARRPEVEPGDSYWARTRGPISALLFTIPLMAAYELTAAWATSQGAEVRTGADLWLRAGLERVGTGIGWLPPLILVAAMLTWQLLDRRSSVVRPVQLLAMGLESLVLAAALVGVSRILDRSLVEVQVGAHQAGLPGPALAGRPLVGLVGFLGAGVYEESIFRLALLPLIYRGLRLLQAGDLTAGTLAVTGSSLLFALAHHVGGPGEIFTWYAFTFRWVAGVYFAAAFLLRGFGIAVGTHAAYDVLVGWLDWPPV